MDDIFYYLCLIPVILISLSIHELAHAYVSYRLGDPTARDLGRLTLNPLKHLDPFGTIMLVVSITRGIGFGWAKPVPINPAYYKNRKLGTILVSLAGPLSNVLQALVFAFPLLYIRLVFGSVSDYSALGVLYLLSNLFVRINLGLAVFNMLPVPPLDGSKILSGILPTRYYFKLMEYERYIGLAFILIIFLKPEWLHVVFMPIYNVLATAIVFIVTTILSVLL